MIIKKATEDDAELVLYFIKALAEAENFPYAVEATVDSLKANLLSSTSVAHALIAYEDDKPCGFAVYYFTFSTTTGQKGLHLDDLYMEPDYRGKGFGQQVLGYLSVVAREQACARFEWWALKTNEPAIKFYQKIGARSLDEISVFRLEKEYFLDVI